jgi:hypothetical protein
MVTAQHRLRRAGLGGPQRIPLADVPLTRKGTIGFQVDNAMASVAAAWALNLDWAAIAPRCTFVSDAETAPGRFNVFDYRGATLIADYGHNPDAILALVRAVEAMPAKRAPSSSAAPATGATRTSASRPRSSATPSTRSSSTRTSASAAAPTAKCSACCARASLPQAFQCMLVRNIFHLHPIRFGQFVGRVGDARLPASVIRQHDEALAVRIQPAGRVDAGNIDEIAQGRARRIGGELGQDPVRLVEQEQP